MRLTIDQTITFNVLGHEIVVDPLGPNFQEQLVFVSQLSGIDMTDMFEIFRNQAKQDLKYIFDDIDHGLDVSRGTPILLDSPQSVDHCIPIAND